MNQLTKREKTLIYILVCVIVFVAGLFLMVMPSFEQYITVKAEYDQIEQELQKTKSSIPDYNGLDEKIKIAEKAMNKVKNNFYSIMNKEDADQLVTTFVIDHGLVPVSLIIDDIAEEEVMGYDEFLASQKKEEEQNKTKDNEEKKVGIQANVYNISMRVTGSIASLQSLVHDANRSYSMKVSSVQYSDQLNTEKEMSITFKIFMVN